MSKNVDGGLCCDGSYNCHSYVMVIYIISYPSLIILIIVVKFIYSMSFNVLYHRYNIIFHSMSFNIISLIHI